MLSAGLRGPLGDPSTGMSWTSRSCLFPPLFTVVELSSGPGRHGRSLLSSTGCWARHLPGPAGCTGLHLGGSIYEAPIQSHVVSWVLIVKLWASGTHSPVALEPALSLPPCTNQGMDSGTRWELKCQNDWPAGWLKTVRFGRTNGLSSESPEVIAIGPVKHSPFLKAGKWLEAKPGTGQVPSNPVSGEPAKDSRQRAWQYEFSTAWLERQAVWPGERREPSWKRAYLGRRSQSLPGCTEQLWHRTTRGNVLSRVWNTNLWAEPSGTPDWICPGVDDVGFSKFSPSDAKTWPGVRKPTGP